MTKGIAFHRHRRASRAFAAAVALVLWVTSGFAATPASAAKARARITYTALVFPRNTKMCTNETVEFFVSIFRTTTTNGRNHGQIVAGGYVIGKIANQNLGRFEPADQGRPVSAQPQAEARFVFRAKAPGRTNVVFSIKDSGEEQRVRTRGSREEGTISVEIVDCWWAHTSGVATTFTKSDMKDLSQPFSLKGYIAGAGVKGATQKMYFTPLNRTSGVYMLIDTAWPDAMPNAKCTAYVAGMYDVVFYGDPARPVEGDLLMDGSGVMVCGAIKTRIDYRGTGFQIGFRPVPPPP